MEPDLLSLQSESGFELIMSNGEFSCFLAQSGGAPRKRFKQFTAGTYTGLIAHAIQESPDKKLSFKQIMKMLEPHVLGEKRSIENNIRVCLSSNKCFVKVPVDPDFPNPKKNFWKVDESGITPKMFRRHFKHIMHMFPGISALEDNSFAHETLIPVCKSTENTSEVKFTGPFSIESLLKNDREVKRMRSTQMEEHHREPTKRRHFYDTVECFYPISAGCHLVSTNSPRQSSGLQFGLSLPQQMNYDHLVFLNSSLMFDTRYVNW